MIKKWKALSLRSIIVIVTLTIVIVSLTVSNLLAYSSFTREHDDLIEETSAEINKQIVMNYQNYLNNLVDTAHYLQLETVYLTRADDFDALSTLYTYAVDIDPNMVSITLFDLSGNPILSTIPASQIHPDVSSFAFFRNAVDNENIFHFAAPALQSYVSGSGEEVITVSRVFHYYNEGVREDAVLVMDLDTRVFRALAQDTNLGEKGHVLLVDHTNQLIFDPENICRIECKSLDAVSTLYLGGAAITVDDDNLYAQVNTLRYTRWKIVTFQDVSGINQTRQSVLLTFGVIFGGSILVTSIAAILLSNRISKPLDSLKAHMETFKRGAFLPIEIKSGQKEVVLLSERFNHMASEIEQLMDRVYKEQRAKRKTHFQALQNQINPHFLYNTLDSILYLSEQNRNDDVQKMVVALSKFFRLSISNESGEVRLEEEVEHARNYLMIQQIRYHEVFTFTLNVDSALLNYQVLKLSLQPLVENAISHGIDPQSRENTIAIDVSRQEDMIHARVTNSGYGLSEAQIDAIRRMIQSEEEVEHIGLKNIYQRLKLQFGDLADLRIESDHENTTTVTLIYPLKEGRKA